MRFFLRLGLPETLAVFSTVFLTVFRTVASTGCCSQMFLECDVNWCGSTKESCEACGGSFYWLENGALPPGSCITRWNGCGSNPGGCCSGATCRPNTGNWMQCLADTDDPPINNSSPTPVPAASPTESPVANPTPSPITPAPITSAPIAKAPPPTNSPVDSPTQSPVTQYPITSSPITPAPVANPPSPTNSPIDAPTQSPVGSGGSGGTITPGKATYYGGNESGNACGYKDLPKVSFPMGFAAAAGGANFNEGYGCGACFEIKCEGPYSPNPSCLCDSTTPSVIVQVTDQCPECSDTHFDLNTESMELIVGDGLAGTCGVISTSFRRVNCDFQSNIKIRSKSGTSQWWYGLHVDDVAGYGDISGVKIRDSSMTDFDISCDKAKGSTFWHCNIESVKPINAPMDVELTDSAGRVLVGTNVITNLNGDQEFDFGLNFPSIPVIPDTPTFSPTKAPTTPYPTVSPTTTPMPSADSAQSPVTQYPITSSPITPAPVANPPSPTNSPIDAPTQSPVGLDGSGGTMTSGKATYYGGNESGNACGYKDLPKVSFPMGFAAAAGGANFNEGYGCGACFEIKCEGPYSPNPSCLCDSTTPSVIVQVTDQCPECSDTHFDLNTESMELIVGDGLAGTCGVISTSFRRVNCDFQSNIKIRSKSGTSQWWYGLHVDDVAGYGDISGVKIRDSSMTDFDISCDKAKGSTFWHCNIESVKPINAPMDVELTDSAGRVLVGTNVITNLNGDQEFDFGLNFPSIPVIPDTPTFSPTKAPTTPYPTVSPTTTPMPSADSVLLTTMNTKNAWEVFQGLQDLTQVNSMDPPNYSFLASGGAAGGGGSVVSEGQGYALLITGLVLASWDEYAGKVSGSNRADVLDAFEGYYNFWKKMCQNSVGGSTCQNGGAWNYCYDAVDNKNSVCLPDWKQTASGSNSEETGNAPDGDVDAIVGIILAVKAVADDATLPTWYDEARKWADASSTAFFTFNVESTYFGTLTDHRMLKLGACWGGWDHNGNNPSYHSPGSFKVMRDYQASFPDTDRIGYSKIPESEWNKLVATSYEALKVAQCSADGALVPNWATFTIDTSSGGIKNYGAGFSGSGTPQDEYGSEAARTTWRVAFDAAMYPQDATDWAEYLDPFVVRLRNGYTGAVPRFWQSESFPNCSPVDVGNTYNMFDSWLWNAFIYGPTLSALVAGAPEDGDMIDSAGTILAEPFPTDYYHRSWAMLANLALSGAIENAGKLI